MWSGVSQIKPSVKITPHCFFALLFLTICISQVNAQYVNVPVTGFNNDIVANGVGTNSVLGITNNQIGIDGKKYYFIDNTFKYTSANALPTCYMPTNLQAPSIRTTGLTYSLQSYTAFNALTLDNNSTTYTTSPYPNTGTLMLSTPATYSKLFVLYESVVWVSPMTVNATVTFADASTQVFNGNTCVNWFTATQPAFSNVGRGTATGTIQCGAFPNLFELQLTLLPANYQKQVASISVTIPTTLTTGTFAYSVNYFHAMAVSGQVAPTGVAAFADSNFSLSVFPNPTSDKITVQTNQLENNCWFILSDISGKEVDKVKLENASQVISTTERSPGLYFYQLVSGSKILYTGKIIINKETY